MSILKIKENISRNKRALSVNQDMEKTDILQVKNMKIVKEMINEFTYKITSKYKELDGKLILLRNSIIKVTEQSKKLFGKKNFVN